MMTTDLATLRALLAAAPGRLELDAIGEREAGIAIQDRDEFLVAEMPIEWATLIVALRNHATALLDRLEAAEAVRPALALIAAMKGKTLIGYQTPELNRIYGDGANRAFEQCASIAEDALSTYDRTTPPATEAKS